MTIVSSVWHVVSAAGVFVLGGLFSLIMAKMFHIGLLRSLTIYLWHTIFSMIYLWYVLNFGGDALWYFEDASTNVFDFGTFGVIYLTGLIVEVLDLSILGVFLSFNIFGFIGLLAMDGSLRAAIANKSKHLNYFASAIIFLPSMSFWSSAIGKDALSFMSAGLALWASLALRSRWILMAFAVAIMLLARPHIATIMLIAWIMATSLQVKLFVFKDIAFRFFLIVAAFLIIPFSMEYAGLSKSFDFFDFQKYIHERSSYNLEGAGGVDIQKMSFPMQLFTYMFRPFIFEVNDFFFFAAAVDNMILLCLFILGVLAILRGKSSSIGESRTFLWIYSILCWSFLAMSTANMGIALRQKWMFAPMLIFLLISALGNRRVHINNLTKTNPSD